MRCNSRLLANRRQLGQNARLGHNIRMSGDRNAEVEHRTLDEYIGDFA
jgi:hypothetical protein